MTKKPKPDKHGNLPPCTVTNGRKIYDPTPEVQERVDAIVAVLNTLLIGCTAEHIEQLVVELDCRLPMRTKAELKRAIQHDQECLEYLEAERAVELEKQYAKAKAEGKFK